MKRVAVTRNTLLRTLFYGKPGSTKTTLAASAGFDERSAPVLWLDAGGNPISIAHQQAKMGRRFDGDVLQLESVNDLQEIYRWLANGQAERDPFRAMHDLRTGYKSLVFDGITHVQRQSFDQVLGATNLLPGAMPPLAQWPAYRQVLGQMILIASKFYTLPMHVIVTALEHEDLRPVSPTSTELYRYIEPMLSGQSVEEFPGWALSVGRVAQTSTVDPMVVRALKAEDSFAIVQFRPTRYVNAKDQHRFGDYIADPTISKLLDIIAPPAKKA
jgi:hypothetical protein